MENQHIEAALQAIDRAQDLSAIYISEDHRCRIEEEVWSELSESVEQGWRTQEEAQDLFMAWRGTYLSIQKKRPSHS